MLSKNPHPSSTIEQQPLHSPHVVDLRVLYKEEKKTFKLFPIDFVYIFSRARGGVLKSFSLFGLISYHIGHLFRKTGKGFSNMISGTAKGLKEMKPDFTKHFTDKGADYDFVPMVETFTEPAQEFYEKLSDDLEEEVKDFKTDYRNLFRLKPALSFASIMFLLILPFKGFSYFESLDDLRIKVLTSSTSAIHELFSAGESAKQMKFKNASNNFTEASKQFATAQTQLNEINSLLFELAKRLPNKEAKLAGYSKTIVEAGRSASDIGSHLTAAVDGLLNHEGEGMGESLNKFTDEGKQAVSEAKHLNQLIISINTSDLPANYQQSFAELKDKAGLFDASLSALVEAVEKIKLVVGMDRDTRYLLVFQNNAEMRASGGFFGSYALIDFSRGKIKNLEVPAGGTYDVEAGYHERIIAPSALHLVNPLWHLWDANWWYDWPTTANKLSWFYEKSGGPTVDGVISLTPTVIEDFLRAYGPVDMTKDYGVVITADNFWETTQSFAEQKPDVTKKPKRIIGDLFNTIIKEFPNRLDRNMLLKIVLSTEKSFDEKQALLYFKDERLAEWVASYGWDGRAKQTSQDYLAVINSSVAGGKSDKDIEQKINHHATVLSDGSIIDELEIIRFHPVIRGTQFTGVRNVNWLRVYVPEGSELIEATGFKAPDQRYFEQPDQNWKFDESLAAEDRNFQLDSPSGTKIYHELGKTVFANWSMMDPGETVRIYFKYKLPFSAKKVIASEWPVQVKDLFGIKDQEIITYGLLAQKQPGSLKTDLTSSLNLAPYARANNSRLAWSYPRDAKDEIKEQGWEIARQFLTDQYYAILIEKK